VCEQEPETVLSWGVRDVRDPGISVSMRHSPGRLVIEIQAPMSLLNLGRFAEDPDDTYGGSAERDGSGGSVLPGIT
jgi:hypothetical protein